MLDKIKNIEKKYSLLVFLFFTFIPMAVGLDYDCWQFGFASGLGLAGYLLLPDKEK